MVVSRTVAHLNSLLRAGFPRCVNPESLAPRPLRKDFSGLQKAILSSDGDGESPDSQMRHLMDSLQLGDPADDPALFDDPYDLPGFDPFESGWSPYMGLDDDGRPLFLKDL